MNLPTFRKRHRDFDEDQGTAIGALWQQMERFGVFTTNEIINEPLVYPYLVVCYGYKCKKGEACLTEKEFKLYGRKMMKNRLPNEIRFQIEDDIKLLGDDLINQYREAVRQLKEEAGEYQKTEVN